MVGNLYVHFPFCRQKCSYCALHSRAGSTPAERDNYVARIARAIASEPLLKRPCRTIYFGGGSPGMCNLTKLQGALEPLVDDATEFSVELNPADVSRENLLRLKALGVNRISMGLQSLDDNILRDMRRNHTFDEAEKAFALIKEHFDNAGIDLIVGYPGETSAIIPRLQCLARWKLKHCSVYSLILEENSILAKTIRTTTAGAHSSLPDDDTVLNRIAAISRFLHDELGLERYEISNYATPGAECRHNLATWLGEDYLGFGDGACGRIGRQRTRNYWGQTPELAYGLSPEIETVSEEQDEIERRIFALRTKYGLDCAAHPSWCKQLDVFVDKGLLTRNATIYRLTERGMEVCDSILAQLV